MKLFGLFWIERVKNKPQVKDERLHLVLHPKFLWLFFLDSKKDGMMRMIE